MFTVNRIKPFLGRFLNVSTRRLIHSSSESSRTASAQPKTQHLEENRKARFELAAAYRGLDKLGLNEAIFNHVTVMAPGANGDGEVMLVIPFGLHWSEVTASSLVGVNGKGEVVEGEGSPEETATCIHLGVRQNKKWKCLVHTHAPYITALSTLKDPTVTMIQQNVMRFYKKIAYDTSFEGAGNTFEEGKRLGEAMGDKEVLIMGNHGALTAGMSVAMAFDAMYYLERAALFQVLAMSTGKEIRHIPDHVCQQYIDYYKTDTMSEEYAEPFFQAIIRQLFRECPDFAE